MHVYREGERKNLHSNVVQLPWRKHSFSLALTHPARRRFTVSSFKKIN